jgi:arylsulfatase A-like enzyme
MRYRTTCFLTACVIGASLTDDSHVDAAGGADGAPRPNIVLIMTDDSGYSDLGCYGGEIETPTLDSLARNGLRFARFYTNARCSPTRASLMTGLWPHMVGAGDLCRPGDETPYPGYLGYMSRDNVTVAEVVKSAGYDTLMSGKWHLGGERIEGGEPAPGEIEKWPIGRGFDRFFGLIHGATNYFDPYPPRLFRLGTAVYPHERHEGGFYATDAITDFALEFVDDVRQKDRRPFFLYLPYTAPHSPLQAPDELVSKYRAVYKEDWRTLRRGRFQRAIREGVLAQSWEMQPNEEVLPAAFREGGTSDDLVTAMATHAAMLERVDRNVARVVAKLDELEELNNTLLVYLSDNGGAGQHNILINTPFVGNKGNLREGGTATHCIVHWPDVITAEGQVTQHVGHVVDWLPTFVELAGADYPETYQGVTIPPTEGISLVPIFRGQPWMGHQHIFWDLYGQQAVVRGPWKYYRDVQGNERLYHLEKDGTEMRDVARQHPQIVRELRDRHAVWAKRCNVLPLDVVQAAQPKHQRNGKN